MPRALFVALMGLSAIVLSGCCMQVRVCCKTRCCPPRASKPAEAAPAEVVVEEAPAEEEPQPAAVAEALYDGTNGKPASLMVAADSWKDVDLIAFGELHGNAVGANHQFALLKALHEQERPVAMAMEFFERDTQAVLDRYLKGEVDIDTLKKEGRQGRGFDATHRRLIDYCKEHGIPVIAANAPRRLVRAYRKQDADFDTWKASLPEADQGFLPEETSTLDDEYSEKFMKLMGPARGPSFFRSQSLWDDAMAEAMVDFKSENPNHRILLIVGAFHVEKGLGTVTKYRMRRGKDEVRILTMTMDKEPTLPFRDEDLGKGDLVLKVPYPAPRKAPAKAAPKGHPKP